MMKIYNPFKAPSAMHLAVQELEDAKRELLASLSAQEYATAMVAYNTDRVRRLSATVASTNHDFFEGEVK